MASNNSRCTVKIEVDPAGAAALFLSGEMRDAVEQKAAALAQRKANAARKHLHSPTRNGLYGYRMKQGDRTWLAVIRPTDPAGYAIGKKYGIKNL